MGLKNFDAKQFLLQHWERVGLYVAAGLMALLLVLGLWKTASAVGTDNASKIKGKNEDVLRMISTSAPSPDKAAEMAAIDKKMNVDVAFQQVYAAQFPAEAPWFAPQGAEENKRRNPHILQPVEFVAQPIFTQLRAYKLSPDKEKILVVEGFKGEQGKSFGSRFAGFGNLGGSSGFGALGGGRPGFPGGGMPGSGMSGGGMPGGGMPGGGFPGGGMPGGMMGMRGGSGPGRGVMGARGWMNVAREDFTTRYVPIERLSKETNVKPAEDILPMRMVEVVASFPYKKQLDEFQHALLYKNLNELLASESKPVFLGFSVERTDVRPGQAENWTVIDLDKAFRPLQLLTGRQYEPDPPDLEPVSFLGLVVPKLRQCREDQYPPLELGEGGEKSDKYPGLKHLVATIEQLKKEQRGPIAKPANPFKDDSDVSIFDKGSPAAAGTPGGGGGPSTLPNTNGNLPNGTQGTVGSGTQGQVVPDYCLVRFFDPTVQPGKTYKYRVRIRMANPNYGKSKDVVGPSMAKEKELASDPVELPEPVVMPEELHYYAVDMKVQEKTNRDFYNYQAADQAALTNHVPVQIQHWLETVYDLNPNSKNSNIGFPVGDWVIADRTLLTRGEYISRQVDVEVPIWDMGHDVFTLANFKRFGPRSRNNSKVPVYFGDEIGAGDPILVDFRGGTQILYDRLVGMEDDKPDYKTIKDPSTSSTSAPALEMLFLMPDGKLLVHDGVKDAEAYKERYDQVKKRLEEIKNQKEPHSKTNKTGGNPFDK